MAIPIVERVAKVRAWINQRKLCPALITASDCTRAEPQKYQSEIEPCSSLLGDIISSISLRTYEYHHRPMQGVPKTWGKRENKYRNRLSVNWTLECWQKVGIKAKASWPIRWSIWQWPEKLSSSIWYVLRNSESGPLKFQKSVLKCLLHPPN